MSLASSLALLRNPQSGKAKCQPELPEQCVLLSRHLSPLHKAVLDCRVIRIAQCEQLAFTRNVSGRNQR